MGLSPSTSNNHVPGLGRLARLPQQIRGINPFWGELAPSRVPFVSPRSGRPTLPFPHPWNFKQPIEILETYFWNVDQERGSGRHNRYFDAPGFSPVFVTRDPAVIRAITTETGDREGQFDRDTLPSTGIARATGKDTLLFSNGPTWRRQRKLAASPFGKTALFQPEMFHEFAEAFRITVHQRLTALRALLEGSGQTSTRVQLEPEIKAVMLELLTNKFFGAEVPYEELRHRFVPALERTIDHIVRDTVLNRLGVPTRWLPRVIPGIRQLQDDAASFDELTTRVLAMRRERRGLWKQFKSDAPDEALCSNLKVFLAGALEATTSQASWAISHLARHPAVQERVFQEVRTIQEYTPKNLANAKYLGHVMDETLRLTPSLYFLPRRSTRATTISTAEGRSLGIPQGTHILLDVWHANRHEDHWSVQASGHPADRFVPERWDEMAAQGRKSKEMLHFGFGHGPRVCPGKHLAQLEVSLVVGVFVKLFRFQATHPDYTVRAGVSTKPADATEISLQLRDPPSDGAFGTLIALKNSGGGSHPDFGKETGI